MYLVSHQCIITQFCNIVWVCSAGHVEQGNTSLIIEAIPTTMVSPSLPIEGRQKHFPVQRVWVATCLPPSKQNFMYSSRKQFVECFFYINMFEILFIELGNLGQV